MNRAILVVAALAVGCGGSDIRKPHSSVGALLMDYVKAWEDTGSSHRIAALERQFRAIAETTRGQHSVRAAIDDLQADFKKERSVLLQQVGALRAAGRVLSQTEESWLKTSPGRMKRLDDRLRRLKRLRSQLFGSIF